MITAEGLLSDRNLPGVAVKQPQAQALAFQAVFVSYDGAASPAALGPGVSRAHPHPPHTHNATLFWFLRGGRIFMQYQTLTPLFPSSIP